MQEFYFNTTLNGLQYVEDKMFQSQSGGNMKRKILFSAMAIISMFLVAARYVTR